MSRHFIDRSAREKIHLPGNDTEYIEIRAKLGKADVDQLNSMMLQFTQTVDDGGGASEVGVKVADFTMAVLERSITHWELFEDEECTKRISFDRAKMRDWDPDDPFLDAVYERILELNPSLGLQGQNDEPNT
jgi:hypothetical protein